VIHALRRLGLAVALAAAWAPIVAFRWWAFLVTLPALGLAFALDPDIRSTGLLPPSSD
jgi:hypothetical protein